MKYLLDTSALLALYQDESGADTVAGLFAARGRGEAGIYVSFMSIYEITYLAMARGETQNASSLVWRVRSLGMEEIWPDDDLLRQAASIKAQGGLSVSDSWTAASAAATEAVLVHRDPEFDRLGSSVKALSIGC
jgi:predicted nucleic acid-binding protein